MLGGDVSSNCENCFDGVRDREDSLGGLDMLTSAVAGVGAVAGAVVAEVYKGGRAGTLPA